VNIWHFGSSWIVSTCTPSHSYGTSLAIWYHIMLPATRHKQMRPALTPAMQAGTRFTYPGGMEGWVDRVDLIVHRPGVESATFWSRVQPWIAAPPRQLMKLAYCKVVESYSLKSHLMLVSHVTSCNFLGKWRGGKRIFGGREQIWRAVCLLYCAYCKMSAAKMVKIFGGARHTLGRGQLPPNSAVFWVSDAHSSGLLVFM